MRSFWSLLQATALSCCAALAHADDAADIARFTPEQLDASLRQSVAETLPELPIKVDKVTTIDGVYYVAARKEFTFRYKTTVSLGGADVKAKIAKTNCVNPRLRAVMSRGITLQHLYFTPTGMIDIKLTSKDC
jgi:hypothetical protein